MVRSGLTFARDHVVLLLGPPMFVVASGTFFALGTGPRRSLDHLVALVEQGHRIALSTLVLYEWLRGPRTTVELRVQEELFPRAAAVPFDADATAQAAKLYTALTRTHGREVDLAVAACALAQDAALWTLNDDDFSDVPGLELM